ncbi:hypothetical protein EIP91_008234 [Steccherinum ochraceum]|uniref:ABC transmembrane type-1 domain-containing protein n=1 Tax=Steccherinum ochraceum TaxID=92696 RepID=A0A4R0RBD0_9APHY|nr:hypothetical protein EIP91_008234 [Steccherinum ochraceum]
MPRQYTPVVPENVPEDIPSTNTSSWLAMATTHAYSDSIIWKANRVKHLQFEELPPLSDRYYMKNLIDVTCELHLGLRLMFRVFPWEHAEMALMLFLRVFTSFIGPIGINRLLNYLETGGESAIVQPWTNVLTQAQAILTQLIFDHVLRMRVKTDITNTTGDSATTSAAKKSAGSNLVGRLSNLVTTDLTAIQDGQSVLGLYYLQRDFFYIRYWAGGDVYPGLAVMIALIPIPGYVAKILRNVQVQKMKKSDSRVQDVTETMNSIRMVKLFGWERKRSQQLDEKREDELRAVRKQKLLSLFNGIANPIATIIVTYATYTVIMKETLTASKVLICIHAHF